MADDDESLDRAPSPAVIAGCEPFSAEGTGDVGVLVVHGFTGNPSSMRAQAHAAAAAGYHVEQPRLPGHGTTLDDMMSTAWSDWSGAAADAYDVLARRVDSIVVIGLSMGGTLTLWTGLQRLDDPRLRGLVCVNPATMPQDADTLAALRDMVASGTDVMPAIGSDIADPEQSEIAYDGTPLRALLSLVDEGVTPIADRYGELSVPLLLFTSTNDHVVPPANSDHLVATYGGPVEQVVLDRSFHVATQDFDRDLISDRSVEFVAAVTGDAGASAS
ncbi:MAG: alpha/beta fold hydrolase [Actinomycetota bacterium]